MDSVKSENRAAYVTTGAVQAANEDEVIARALGILQRRVKAAEWVVGGPSDLRDYLTLKLGGLEREEFFVVFMDARNRVMGIEGLFRGTLTQCSVYPREVVKAALARNAAAVAFAHNHPSGSQEASQADELLTKALRNALQLVDVRTLDHFIVTPAGASSMAERGLI